MKRSRETGLQGTVHVQARHILRSPMTPTVREGLAPLATLAKEIGLDGARHALMGEKICGVTERDIKILGFRVWGCLGLFEGGYLFALICLNVWSPHECY